MQSEFTTDTRRDYRVGLLTNGVEMSLIIKADSTQELDDRLRRELPEGTKVVERVRLIDHRVTKCPSVVPMRMDIGLR